MRYLLATLLLVVLFAFVVRAHRQQQHEIVLLEARILSLAESVDQTNAVARDAGRAATAVRSDAARWQADYETREAIRSYVDR